VEEGTVRIYHVEGPFYLLGKKKKRKEDAAIT
jgi:hypothetical protein